MHSRKTLPSFAFALSLFLGAASAASLSAAADDGSGLGSTNFGNILPQAGLGQAGPFSAPSFGDNLPSSYNRDALSPEEFPGLSQQGESPTQPTTISLDRPNAWYKFLEPSLSLTRALEESERKHLLSIVPVPLNLRPTDPHKSENRIVLLRADNSQNYACFKTVYGGVYARNDALLLVSSGKVVRISNISGKEKDLVFKLPNGQMILIGPGSEMVISRSLAAQDLNATDGVARRGFTRPMKCSDLQMAFAQFSFQTMLELPELKYFCAHQNATYMEGLNATISMLNGIRGQGGFRTAVQPNESVLQKAKNPAAKPLALAGKSLPDSDRSKVQTRTEDEQKQKQIAEQKAAGERKQKQIVEQRTQNERKQKQLAEQKAENERKQKQLAAKRLKDEQALLSTAEIVQPEGPRKLRKAQAKSEPARQIAESETAARRSEPLSAAQKAEKQKMLRPRLSSLSEKVKNSFAYNVFEPPAKTAQSAGASRKLLPRKLPGPGTPPDIAKLLLDAEQEEKLSISLRKKADKCMAFIDGGLMGPEQQKRMMIEAKRHLQDAAAAEERCQALRRQVEIAETGRSSL